MDYRIAIVGVGGGGGRMVDAMVGALGDGPAVAAVNTDARALAECRAPTRLQVGSARTGGLGTGGDAAVGRQSAEDDIEMIQGLFAGAHLAIVAAGLGGGTGTGAAPVVAKAAREAGALTLCFATLPFEFEGRERRALAYRGVGELKDAVEALILVPNDRLAEAVAEGTMADLVGRANEALAAGVAGIWKLLAQPGYLNLDFADLRKAVQSARGVCTFGYGDGRGDGRAQAAVTSLLESPLLEHGQVVAGAESLLLSIVGGPDITLREVGDIMAAVSARAKPEGRIFMGTIIDEAWRGRITLTAVASEKWAAPEEAPAPAEPTAAAGGEADARGKKGRGRRRDPDLGLDGSQRGRFKDVEPTMLDGQDLDVPTFVRRKLAVEK